MNKDGTQIKTKCNVSFLKSFLDSDETKDVNDENPPSSAIDKNHMILKKLIAQV